jgi:hypothetical protein
MRNRIFWAFQSIFVLLGLALGYRLSALPKLETYKLLNVWGLSYSFFAVVVLSEVLGASAKWKTICVKFLAPAVLWFCTLFPFGALAGALTSLLLADKPNAESFAKFCLYFFGYSVIPLSILNDVVVLPKLPFLRQDIDTRWRWFGLFLLLSGVAFQLIAAIMAIG